MTAAPPHSRRRALLGINLVSFFWGLGMGASMPVIPLLSYQFIPDLALAGIVTATGGVGALFTGYLSGPLMDRFGRRGITLFGIGLRTLFSFAEGFAPSYAGLVVARLGSAIGTSVYGTGLSVMTADIATSQDRGAIVGGRQTLAQIGNVLGPVLGGVLWAATGDIRTPFLFNGLCKLVCFFVFLYVMQETRANTPAATAASELQAQVGGPSPLSVPDTGQRSPSAPAGTGSLSGGATRRPASLAPTGPDQDATSALGSPDDPGPSPDVPLLRVLLSTGFAFVVYVVFLESLFKQAIINVVLPVYVRTELGRSETELGLILGGVSVGALLMAFPAGFLADRLGVRAGVILGSLLTGAALAAAGASGQVDVALAVVMGAGTALFIVGGQAFSIDLAPPGARGHFFAIRGAASNAAILAGPLAVGLLTEALGYSFPFLLLAAFVLALIPLSFLIRARPLPAPSGK